MGDVKAWQIPTALRPVEAVYWRRVQILPPTLRTAAEAAWKSRQESVLKSPVQARKAIAGCLRHLGFSTHVGADAQQPPLGHVDIQVPLDISGGDASLNTTVDDSQQGVLANQSLAFIDKDVAASSAEENLRNSAGVFAGSLCVVLEGWETHSASEPRMVMG